MPDRFESVDVTCAANVLASNPTEVALGFDGGKVRRLRIVIPDGHAGMTGIAVGYAHNPVIPYKHGTFISGNDERIDFEYNDGNPGVTWSAFVCNLDTIVHSWEVRFEIDDTWSDQLQVVTQPLTPAAIAAAGAQAMGG